eukprot:scaffold150626_cov50-Prasinocladus_malaysianus.AAC.2
MKDVNLIGIVQIPLQGNVCSSHGDHCIGMLQLLVELWTREPVDYWGNNGKLQQLNAASDWISKRKTNMTKMCCAGPVGRTMNDMGMPWAVHWMAYHILSRARPPQSKRPPRYSTAWR